ncbi:hypothetical protein AGMMS49938_05740 [Fibrobacterales bacterium]|nr:hypothetical protein AGMMS49938_05740 [Fibrobacterales bacterium]
MKVLATAEYNEFVDAIKSNDKQIICYGTGSVALSSEDIFRKSGIDKNLCCFIDRNPKKHGTTLAFSGRDVIIRGIDELCAMDLSNKVLLLTLEVFGAVIESLNQYPELDNLECYIFPALNRSYIKQAIANDEFCRSGYKIRGGEERIPRTIHYCWFGGTEIPPFMKECIASWSEHNPNYEIVKWNENNYDVYQNNYIKQAYQAGNYAFVSDFARLDVLYKHGGIYFDTDVKVLKNLDDVLYNNSFIAYSKWSVLNSAVSGSMAGNEIIQKMRDYPRSTIDFVNTDGSYNLDNNSVYESATLAKFGFHKNFIHQSIMGMTVYPPCFFSTAVMSGLNYDIDERTYAVHYAVGTWFDSKRTAELMQTNAYIANLKNTLERH